MFVSILLAHDRKKAQTQYAHTRAPKGRTVRTSYSKLKMYENIDFDARMIYMYLYM